MRRPGQRKPAGAAQGGPTTRLISLPAPTKGWVSAQNIAMAVPGTALVMENIYPTQTGVQLRRGSQLQATIGSDPVETLMAYVGSTQKLFATDEAKIFDITTVADPEVPPAASVTGQTSGYYGWTNFATTGGFYLYAVNGTDSARLFDGTTWTAITGASSPAITGVTTSTLVHVWTYRGRLFFIQKNSMNAWALPVDQIGGAVTQIALGGVFKHGGTLLCGATWSLDSGDGLDDKCVFITSEGEFAVYEGSDPSDPADWGLVGRYDISPLMGKNATVQTGGDLLCVTEQGLVPISAAVSRDPAALQAVAISRPIEPDWVREAGQRRSVPWELVKWTARNKLLVTNPVTGDEATTPPQCFVMNLETGAWCKYTGWNTCSLVAFNDFVYFGTNDGTVMQAEITGSDDGNLIYHTLVYSFDHMGRMGFYKTAVEVRATFITQNEFTPQLSVSTDYSITLPSAPNATATLTAPGEWDVGLWDTSLWDTGASSYTVQTYWVGVGLSGTVHALQLQVTSGSTVAPSAELVVVDIKVSDGDDTGD